MKRSKTTAAAAVDMKRTMASVLALGMVVMTFSVARAQSATPTPVPAATPLEQTVAYTQPSVVYLDITYTGWVVDRFNSDKNGKSYLNEGDPFVLSSSCTGFFVDDIGNIATAGHCVDPKEVTSAFLDAAANWAYTCRCYYSDKTLSYKSIRDFADDDYVVEGSKTGVGSTSNYKKGADVDLQAVWSTSSTQPLYDAQGDLNGDPYPARVVKYVPFDKGDVALLKVEVNEVTPLPVLDEPLDTGAEIIAIGYPGAVMAVSDANLSDPSFKSGTVSSVRTEGTYPVYEMSTPMSGGMSGGPTVNVDGEVVGVNSYGVAGGVAQSFEFSQSSKTLVQLMTDAGVTPGLGEIGAAYRAGLDAYYSGDKKAAVSNLEEAVSLNSDFEMADEFLADAEDLPDPVVAEDSSSSLPLVLGIGLVLLVLAAIGGLVMRNRAPATQPAASTALTQKPPSEPTPPTPIAPASTTVPMPGARADDQSVFCTRCGAQIADADVAFCGRCGARVDSETRDPD